MHEVAVIFLVCTISGGFVFQDRERIDLRNTRESKVTFARWSLRYLEKYTGGVEKTESGPQRTDSIMCIYI